MFRVVFGLGATAVFVAVALWLCVSVLVYVLIPILAVLFGALGL